MSFLSILKKVGSVALGIEHVAAPILGVVIPGAAPVIAEIDNIFKTIQTGVMTAEANHPTDGLGKLKSDAVIADFQSGIALAQEFMAMEGKTIAYDAAALQDAISSQVQAYNAMAALKASFKVVPLPPKTT